MTPISGCSLGLTSDDLSAWGDETLSADEAARVREHVALCPACQGRLSEFATIVQSLRRQSHPEFQDRLWRDLRPRLDQSPRSRFGRTQLWGGVGATIALITLVALAISLLGNPTHSTAPMSVTSPSPRSTHAATPPLPTSTTSPPATLPGWQVGGPYWAQAIAFAPSDHQRAYVCGVAPVAQKQALRSPSRPGLIEPSPTRDPSSLVFITLGTSHDAGQTWTTLPSPINAQTCQISINPLNADDFVVLADQVYRTRDGGNSWQSVISPNQGYTVSWSGLDLFLTANQGSLLVSRDDLTPEAITTPTRGTDHQGGGLIFVYFGTIYVLFRDCTQGGTVCEATAESSHDYGATWQSFSMNYGTVPLILMGSGNDGVTLFATSWSADGPNPDGVYPSALYVSVDGAQSWNRLPTTPCSEFYNHGLGYYPPILMPDGTIYATCSLILTNLEFDIYRLPPGASVWQLVAPSIIGLLLDVSSDADGHATAVWAHAGDKFIDYHKFAVGLQYHTP